MGFIRGQQSVRSSEHVVHGECAEVAEGYLQAADQRGHRYILTEVKNLSSLSSSLPNPQPDVINRLETMVNNQ